MVSDKEVGAEEIFFGVEVVRSGAVAAEFVGFFVPSGWLNFEERVDGAAED